MGLKYGKEIDMARPSYKYQSRHTTTMRYSEDKGRLITKAVCMFRSECEFDAAKMLRDLR